MRISDWSSDVCSSDLATAFALPKVFDERLSGFFHDSVFGIGGMVTIVYTCSALTQLVGGELADRYSLRGVYATVQWLQIPVRSEEHTSELQSLMRISYAVFCLKKKNKTNKKQETQ